MSEKSFYRSQLLYGVIPRSIFDEEISWKAKGALAYLIASEKPETVPNDEDFTEAVAELKEKKFLVEVGDRIIIRETPEADPVDQELLEADDEKEEVVSKTNCPMKRLTEMYNEMCPSLRRLVKITGTKRENLLRARWKENPDIDFFAAFFARVESSHFLTGKVDVRPGRSLFVADFDWIMRPNNFVKILEGKYDNREISPAPQRPQEQSYDPNRGVELRTEAGEAWAALVKYVRDFGYLGQPDFGTNQIFPRIVASMGGWGAVRSWNTGDLPFRRNEFMKLYTSLRSSGAVYHVQDYEPRVAVMGG